MSSARATPALDESAPRLVRLNAIVGLAHLARAIPLRRERSDLDS